jgi:hypothetical protein
MDTQQIISEIQKLPFVEKKKVLNVLQAETEKSLSEEEIQQILYSEGVIGNLPNLSDYTDEDEDFAPIKISGEPISETIIKERR